MSTYSLDRHRAFVILAAILVGGTCWATRPSQENRLPLAISPSPTLTPTASQTIQPAPRMAQYQAYSDETDAEIEPTPGDEDGDESLDDGGYYSAEVENTSMGYGPYTLDCEKSGSEITITFPNGGYKVLDVSSEDYDGDYWNIDAYDYSDGEDWSIRIEP